MQNSVQQLLIVTKANSHTLRTEAKAIADLATGMGITSDIREDQLEEFVLYTGKKKPDMLLVLGGDGTMLSVMRKLPDKTVPLLGINYGQVGFLTEIEPETWQKELPKVFKGNYSFSPRAVFNFSVTRNGQVVEKGEFVNDLVISRGTLARLIRLRIRYGKKDLGLARADAVIIATPTGSSSYCISAGGPLVHPEVPCLVLCPVSPFLHNFHPIVLPPDQKLHIRVEEKQTTTCLTQDGQVGLVLKTDDEIHIEQAEHTLFLVRLNHSSYFDKLKIKGFLG